MEYVKYNSSLSYSYVFGAFGTIELLNNKPSQCIGVIVDPSFVKNEAFIKKSVCTFDGGFCGVYICTSAECIC